MARNTLPSLHVPVAQTFDASKVTPPSFGKMPVGVLLIVFVSMSLVLFGCGRSDNDRLSELQVLWQNNQFRELASCYRTMAKEFSDSSIALLARRLSLQAETRIQLAEPFISKGNSLARYGFIVEAKTSYDSALKALPNDSVILATCQKLQNGRHPLYLTAGTLGSFLFKYVFHCSMVNDQPIPDSVVVDVTNNDPDRYTSLIHFVPSVNCIRMTERRYAVFVPNEDYFSGHLKTPIFCGQSNRGTFTYHRAKVYRSDERITFASAFREVIVGKDATCFLSLAGYDRQYIRGLEFAGFEDAKPRINS